MSAYYYRYETKGIQRWILDSNRLRDLAGGSALVETLVEEGSAGIREAGGTVYTEAAGGITATFPGLEELEAFASEWPMHVAYRAPGLQVVQAWVEEAGRADPLGDLFDRLLAKRNHPPAPVLEAGPWVERAGRSGLPAIPAPRVAGDRVPWKTLWDRASAAKERAWQELGGKRRLFGGLVTAEEIESDLDDWADEPFAVIHADGSGVGTRLMKAAAEGVARLRSFSKALGEATTGAAKRALDALRSEQKAPPLELRPVVLGGDDLTVLLPAANALTFVRVFLDSFEEETANRAEALGGKLHAGAGAALVNRGYPFHLAYEAAETDVKHAKKSVLRSGEPASSAVCLRRITTALPEEQLRSRPWPLERLGGLADLTQVARGLPRGALRSWLALVEAASRRMKRESAAESGAERSRAQQRWERIREVAQGTEGGKERWTKFASALEAVDADPETGLFRPRRDEPEGSPDTPLRDALMLGQIVRRRKGSKGKEGRP